MRNISKKITMMLIMIAICSLIQAKAKTLEIVPNDVKEFFITPGVQSRLSFNLKQQGGSVLYSISDYWGKIIKSKTVPVNKKSIQIKVSLAPGYYEINFPVFKETFGICSIAAFTEKEDPFFCMDTAISQLVKDKNIQNSLIYLLKRSGVYMARERLSWNGVHPNTASWRWSWRSIAYTREKYKEYSVKLLEMVHGYPRSLSHKRSRSHIPWHLNKAVDSMKSIVDHIGRTAPAYEVFNEPDSSNIPADQYMPAVKAVAYAFTQSKTKPILCGGVFSACTPAFPALMVKNGLLDVSSAVSFHNHSAPCTISKHVKMMRDLCGDKPLWITESGIPWIRGTGRPSKLSDMKSAIGTTMKGIESRACGISSYFAFVFPYYDEKNKNWGMLGKANTPIRVIAAYIQSIKALSHKQYIGDISLNNQYSINNRVFANANEAIAILNTGKPESGKNIILPKGLKVKKVEGADGRLLKLNRNTVSISDGLIYVYCTLDSINKYIKINPLISSLYKQGKNCSSRPLYISPLIIQARATGTIVSEGNCGYRLDLRKGNSFTIAMRLVNLSNSKQQGEISLKISGDFSLKENGTVKFNNIPPRSAVVAKWTVALDKNIKLLQEQGIYISGSDGSGNAISQAYLNFKFNDKLDRILKCGNNAKISKIDIGNVPAWKKNIARFGDMKILVSPNNIWSLNVKYSKAYSNKWAYPCYPFKKPEHYNQDSLIVIRCRSPKKTTARIMFFENNGSYYYSGNGVISTSPKWSTSIVRYDDFVTLAGNIKDPNQKLDLDDIKYISLGMNTLGTVQKNKLEVSDLYIITPHKKNTMQKEKR